MGLNSKIGKLEGLEGLKIKKLEDYKIGGIC